HCVPCFLFGDSNIRGDTVSGLKRVAKNAIVPRILSWCTGVLVCGTLGRDYFARYGVARERMYSFPYEPDYQQIADVSIDAVTAASRRFGLNSDRRYLIYSGRLAPVKRVDLLIEAFTRITAERPDWDLVIVGSGPLEAQLKSSV